MKSVFEPEKSTGNRFFRVSYAYVARKLKIDPVAEGALLQKRIERLFWGKDFLELQNPKEREKRLELANRLTDRYGERSRKFYEIFQLYCYYKGQLRGVKSIGGFIEDPEKERDRVKKKMRKLFEEDEK